MINKIKYAIFDMDGTLIDSLGIWEIVWEELGKKYFNIEGFRPTTEVDKAVRTLTTWEAMELFKKEYSVNAEVKELYDLNAVIIEDFYRNKVELKEGVAEFLEALEEKGVKMAIATATDMKFVKTAMNKCDLYKHFPVVVSCSEVGKAKNEPDVFFTALGKIGGEISSACVFEDSLVAIKTANKAGFMTVGIHDKNNYGQEEIEKTADEYIAEGETLLKLL